MTIESRDLELEDAFRALTVHDVTGGRAARTRDRCLAVMAGRGRTAARRDGPSAWFEWLEPTTALAIGIVYLLAAIRASMVLLTLPPVP